MENFINDLTQFSSWKSLNGSEFLEIDWYYYQCPVWHKIMIRTDTSWSAWCPNCKDNVEQHLWTFSKETDIPIPDTLKCWMWPSALVLVEAFLCVCIFDQQKSVELTMKKCWELINTSSDYFGTSGSMSWSLFLFYFNASGCHFSSEDVHVAPLPSFISCNNKYLIKKTK